MSATLELLMNHKFTAQEKRIGYSDITANHVTYRISSVKKEIDATQIVFNFYKACRLSSASINYANTFIERKFDVGDDGIYKDKSNHIWMPIRLFDVLMYKLSNFKAIDHLLNGKPDWMDYIRGFIYVIYFPKLKKYEFIVKPGSSDNWYGRKAWYKKHCGKFIVLCLFYVKFMSPAEDLMKKAMAEKFGTPLKFKSQEDNVGNEYFQVKGVDTTKQSEIINLLFGIARKWKAQMPKDEILDEWWHCDAEKDVSIEEFNLRLDWNVEFFKSKIDELEIINKKKVAKYRTHNIELLKALTQDDEDDTFDDDVWDVAYYEVLNMLITINENTFVKKCMPKARVSKVHLPWTSV